VAGSAAAQDRPERHSGYPKPVIGIAGGIGSGKSVVARALADLGCGLVDADAAAHEVLQEPGVRAALRAWWGDAAFEQDGTVSRRKIAQIVFGQADELTRLNALVHPRVAARRAAAMAQFMADEDVVAVAWDIPLLFEVGLDRQCDAVIFVKVPYDKRLERVRQTRGWTDQELARREKSQIALDKKENLSDYIVDNGGDVTVAQAQVRQVFSLILAPYPRLGRSQD
jgi:dephospho-CoA kinase